MTSEEAEVQAAYGEDESGVAHGARPSQGNDVGFSTVSFQDYSGMGRGWLAHAYKSPR